MKILNYIAATMFFLAASGMDEPSALQVIATFGSAAWLIWQAGRAGLIGGDKKDEVL